MCRYRYEYTWTPKVRETVAFLDVFTGFGPLFSILLRSRYLLRLRIPVGYGQDILMARYGLPQGSLLRVSTEIFRLRGGLNVRKLEGSWTWEMMVTKGVGRAYATARLGLRKILAADA